LATAALATAVSAAAGLAIAESAAANKRSCFYVILFSSKS
jgi:hypothetical protein